MGRRKAVFVLALAFVFAFSVTITIAAKAPTQVVIDKVAKKKPGVAFDHEKHSKSTDCLKCHHKAASKDEVKGCFGCHGKDAAANDPASGKKDNPFHIVCKGCHKEKDEGPTKCGDCHKK